MATIDGIEFSLTNLLPRIMKTNIRNKIPNGNRTSNTVLGLEGLRLTVEGRVKTEAEYESILKAFLSDGEKSLVTEDGYEYRVFVDKNTPRNHVLMRNYSEYYPFSFNLVSEYPYKFTSATKIRSKSITADGERWSADDSGNDISTTGHVPTVPDIKITGSTPGLSFDQVFTSHTDVNNSSTESVGSTSYVLVRTMSVPGLAGQRINLKEVGEVGNSSIDGDYKITYQFDGGPETTIVENQTTGPSWKYHSLDATGAEGEGLDVNFYIRFDGGGVWVHLQGTSIEYTKYKQVNTGAVSIYNSNYDDNICHVANMVYSGMVARINADSTGHISLVDDMTDSSKTANTIYDYAEGKLTFDTANGKLDVATDGYVIYKIDTKYPVTGIPLLTSLINVSAGTPTIQVAADNGNGEPDTWYDIDQAVVSGASTEYKLRSVANDFKFKGKTIIFVKFSFSGASGSISSIDFDIDMWTIDAAKPIVDTNGANEFSIMFGDASTNECTVDLIYPDRKYVA